MQLVIAVTRLFLPTPPSLSRPHSPLSTLFGVLPSSPLRYCTSQCLFHTAHVHATKAHTGTHHAAISRPSAASCPTPAHSTARHSTAPHRTSRLMSNIVHNKAQHSYW